jgi:hypothetical protein
MFKKTASSLPKINTRIGVVGLTDQIHKARRQYGNPIGWTHEGPFLTEKAALEWKQYYLGQGYSSEAPDTGWRYGFRYPIPNK